MPKIYKARDIARYFLARSEPEADDYISNLKLQKLCYYAQGCSLALNGRPLFSEKIEAWTHGPVVPDLYREFKNAGASALPAVTDLDLTHYEDEDRAVLDEVYDYYGQFSASRLRNMSHDDVPWKEAFDRPDRTIAPATMKDYFAKYLVHAEIPTPVSRS